MKYDIAMVAQSKTKFFLINGWTIDDKFLKYLEGNIH